MPLKGSVGQRGFGIFKIKLILRECGKAFASGVLRGFIFSYFGKDN
jgi:hypothetical protein